MEWNKPETWTEDTSSFPNELVLLLVQISKGTDCLIDAIKGTKFVTMGHWYPEIVHDSGAREAGHWEYVGWDWCQDTFVGTKGDRVIGWARLPTV